MSIKSAISKLLTKFRFPNATLPNSRLSYRPSKFAGYNRDDNNCYQHMKTLQLYPSSLGCVNNTKLDENRINRFIVPTYVTETVWSKNKWQHSSDSILINIYNNNINDCCQHAETFQPSTAKYHHHSSSVYNFNDTELGNKYRINHFINLRNILETTRLRWQHDSDFNLESFKRGTRQVRRQSDLSLKRYFL